ncbi:MULTISPECIES: DUF421 domain-containing protein [Paraliobacillus]|uniref:DUF421 domain-containing protein n=1 Tax=Paraliobacillus TaxID=200903 RepID=UPI000DD45602|nr:MULTISPECIES: DUF421 domain-containing protein [Paraliobacillus]
MSISTLSIRLVIAFATLLILTRMTGRKEISQMTFFNFVSGIAIGTIGASLAIDQTLSIRNGVYALAVWSAITIVIGIIDLKSTKFRYAVAGQPRVVIKEGKIMEEELRKVRLDIDALNVLLRKKNIFAINDVDYAIFETDGSLSVDKKEKVKPLAKTDLQIQNKANVFPTPTMIVSDGKIDNNNLEKLHLNKDWVMKQLESAGVGSIDEVFYAAVQKDGTLYIDNTNDTVH